MTDKISLPPPMPANDAYAPVVHSMPVGAPRYAGFGRRLLGWFVDSMVLNVAFFLALIGAGLIAKLAGGDESGGRVMPPSNPNERSTASYLTLSLLVGVPLVIAWVYYAMLEASRAQATLGKLAAGIRVEDVDGGRATFVQTSARFFVKLISAAALGIGFLLILFTKRGQALHDIGANTIVTRRPPPVPFLPTAPPG